MGDGRVDWIWYNIEVDKDPENYVDVWRGGGGGGRGWNQKKCRGCLFTGEKLINEWMRETWSMCIGWLWNELKQEQPTTAKAQCRLEAGLLPNFF